jgi:hypothetical protein
MDNFCTTEQHAAFIAMQLEGNYSGKNIHQFNQRLLALLGHKATHGKETELVVVSLFPILWR